MNKKNLLWIAILAVLIVILILSKGRENVEKRIELFKFKQADLTRIEIIQPTDTLSLALEGEVWMLTHPIHFPAKEAQIEKFFEEFLTLDVSSIPLSEAYDRQSVYNVDEETGIQIAMYGQNDKLLSKVYFGRNQTSRSAYIRKDNDTKIYQINNDVYFSAINPTLFTWREDRIVTFSQEEVMKIEWGRDQNPFSISQEKGFWEVIVPDSSSIITPTNSTFIAIMNSLTNLRTTVFFDNEYEKYAEKLASPTLEMLITLTSGQTTYFKIAANDAQSYILQKDGDEATLYRLSSGQFTQLNIDPLKLFEE